MIITFYWVGKCCMFLLLAFMVSSLGLLEICLLLFFWSAYGKATSFSFNFFFSEEWHLCLFLFFFSTFSVYFLLLSVRGILIREISNVRFLNLGSWLLWSVLNRLQFDISDTHLMFRYFLMTPSHNFL